MITRLTRSEAESLERQGKAKRTGSHTYVHVRPIAASKSEDSMPSLVPYDMQVVAGFGTPSVEEIERLQGWGFNVPKPRRSREFSEQLA